jgi:hypothetical protein
VKHQGIRSATVLGVIAVLALGVGGCNLAKQTPQVIYVTQSPSPTPEVTPTLEVTPTPTSEATPTPTPEPTPTPTPMAGGGVTSDQCVGSVANQEWFQAAAEAMSWHVYCPTWLPSHYHLGSEANSASYTRTVPGGQVLLHYTNTPSGSAEFWVKQGNFCSGSGCAPSDHDIKAWFFGDLPGELMGLGSSPNDGFAIYLNPGTKSAYEISGHGMSQANFEQIAAQLKYILTS